MQNIVIVCADKDNHCGRGVEYVNTLFNMIVRNIPEKIKFRFQVFSSVKEGYHEAITVRDYEPDLSKEGLFDEGAVVFHFSLDTVIVGGLDNILSYEGDCAKSSHLTIWRSGRTSQRIDDVRELFSSQIIDYEKNKLGIPAGARIAFFNDILPHEVKDYWVPNIWKVGGGSTLELEFVTNVSEDNIRNNIKQSMLLPYEHVDDRYMVKHSGGNSGYESDPLFHVCIVGGGPSLADLLVELKVHEMQGHIIWALGNSFKYLIENGIHPHAQILLDARPENADFIPEKTQSTLLLASQCHPDTFRKAQQSGGRIIIWHRYIDGIDKLLGEKRVGIVGSGTTVGINSFGLAQLFGFKYVHLYGYDSSYREEKNHAFPQKLNEKEKIIDVHVNDRMFRCSPWMASQVEEFKRCITDYLNQGMEFTVHGDGLLPYVVSLMEAPIDSAKPLHVNYDLSQCPASWDFFAWLMNMQYYRKDVGNPELLVHFKSGPNEGFRAHEPAKVPIEQKQRMLNNICKALLPLFNAKETAEEGLSISMPYTLRTSVEAYRKTGFLPDMVIPGEEVVWAEQYRGVFTITLRESDYWPERNSNLQEWLKFADQCGERVMFVRDTKMADQGLGDREICRQPSLDIAKRLALYRVAKMNLFVSNGPFCLALADPTIAYICFIKPIESYRVNTDPWWRKNIGIGLGEQYPWATKWQKIVVCEDTCENIANEVKFMYKLNNSSLIT